MVQIIRNIRALTEDERNTFSGAAIAAVELVPAFRDAIAILRPFYDGSAGIAYTDAYSRVGLAPSFFLEFGSKARASIIVHEAMHVLQGAFSRANNYGGMSKKFNVAADFEINCGINTLGDKADISFMIHPEKFPFNYPAFKSIEQYYAMLSEDPEAQKKMDQVGTDSDGGGESSDSDESGKPEKGENPDKNDAAGEDGDDSGKGAGSGKPSDSEGGENGEGSSDGGESGAGEGSEGAGSGSGKGESGDEEGSGSGSGSAGDADGKPGKGAGKGKPKDMLCDEATGDRSASADEVGIPRSSEVEQSIAMNNTVARVNEERNKSLIAGKESMNRFLGFVQGIMTPPKVKWQSLVRRAVSKANDAIVSGRADYSYRRTNRRSHNSEFVFAGMIQYQPTMMLGLDTSGSMSQGDYMATFAEIESILKVAGKTRNGLEFFTVDAKVTNTQRVKKLKDIDLKGGGGTRMEIAWQYVNDLPAKEKPDIFILATDGGTDWSKLEKEVDRTKKDFFGIILVTHEDGFASVPDSLHKKITVIDISG